MHERRYSYRDAIPAEVGRLRAEGRRYSRWHNGFQWLLILCSAAIPAVAAFYDPPQPGKGRLIGLGASVSVIISAMGYYRFRERSFNLQQTADSIEQHRAAAVRSTAPTPPAGPGPAHRSQRISADCLLVAVWPSPGHVPRGGTPAIASRDCCPDCRRG
ncbi:SLATT domain-containing protein [Streptomyces griseus]|uniref:SLATT domain-containing protein n=1 Tax=Streptomyces griseus TaxID=1911 RepID=UPI00131B5560